MSMISNDSIGGGMGGFGFGGGGFVAGLILGELFRGRGFGGGFGGGVGGAAVADIERFGIQKDVLENRYLNLRDITASNANLTAQNHVAAIEALKCCCETQKNILKSENTLQFEIFKTKADTDHKLCGLAVGQEKIMAEIEKSRLIDKLTDAEREVRGLRSANERSFAAGLARSTISAVYAHANADKEFNGATYNWTQPAGTTPDLI